MSDYPERPAELDRRYADALASETAPTNPDPTPQATLDQIRQLLTSYYAARDKTLADALANNLRPGDDATADSFAAAWRDYFRGKSDDAAKTFDGVASSAKGAMSKFIADFAIVEKMFYLGLGDFPMARALGQTRTDQRSLADRSAKLDELWRTTIDYWQRFDGQLASLRNDILTMFQNIVGTMTSWQNELEDNVRSDLSALSGYARSGAPGLGRVTNTIVREVQRGMDLVAQLRATPDQFMSRALDLYAQRGDAIEGFFDDHRQETKTFLDGNNNVLVQKRLDQATKDCGDAASKVGTDAMVKDAKTFIDKMNDSVRAVGDQYNAAFDAFFGKFDGKYIGNVNDATRLILAEDGFFDQFWAELMNQNMPDKLRSLADKIRSNETISIDDVTDDMRTQVKSYLQAQLEPLRDSIAAIDQSFLDRFKLVYISVPLSQWSDAVKKITGWSK
ncbi:MAG TPA: hypothetical protein VFF06_24865 [Polyangia bacterium]|nr:hypothetical protein [Polyangia bacterium]